MRHLWYAATWTAKVIDVATARGIDVGDCWELAGLARGNARARGERVQASRHLAVWEECMRRARDPSLPIRVAETMSLEDYDLLGLATKTADDVRAALDRISRYLHVWTNCVSVRMRSVGRELRVELVTKLPRSLGVRASMESGVGELAGVLGMIATEPVRIERVCFAHSSPGATKQHDRHFRCPVKFDQRFDGIVLARESLDVRLTLADPGLSRYLEEALAQTARAIAPALLPAVRKHVGDALPAGKPSIGAVAKRLAVSARTLQRRLAEEGTTFAAVVDDVRHELAESLVREPARSLHEVACLLGFAEPASFFHAFRRWTGTTPNRFRSRGD